MKYADLSDSTDFFRNMRKTPWLKLFPHWWSENDVLLNAIGDEVERIKASAIFGLLNAGIKPPVMIWQESLKHDKYNINQDITQLPAVIEIEAPFYKTWGDIILTNNTTDDIDGIEITFDGVNGFAINQLIAQKDVIKIDLTNNKVQLNDHTIKPQIIGKGMPYFITSQNHQTYQEGTPLHNEIIKLKINTDTNLEDTIISNTINVTEKMEDWTINGEAYRYNKQGADPWISITNNTRIGYDLDFTNIKEITFWYKANDNAILSCFVDNKHIFSKNITDTSWHNYVIDTQNITYEENSINTETGETEVYQHTIALSDLGQLEFAVTNTEDVVYINDIKYVEESKYNVQCDINVGINMNDVVFINEQNIEVTGLELVPIEKIELYAKYDFPYNSDRNGWQKVYQKKYDSNTNVVYDMITTHFYTKEFYVDVWFKTLQYPYKVGFPCYQDANADSEFHVNNRLDTWGEQLGLKRRLYKSYIEEEEYPNTFPIYYPYDIEQDYWYYRRLANEYTWNDLAINDIDIKDTDGNNIFRLYSINPFCEDFVVHAKSNYPVDKEFVDYNEYYPVLIKQDKIKNYVAQAEYNNIINLLGNTQFSSSITLNNNSDYNDVIYKKDTGQFYEINTQSNDIRYKTTNESYKAVDRFNNSAHISKELLTFFDLTDLPENVNIDDITITIEAESTDNKTNKFSTEDTGLIIPNLDDEDVFIPLTADKNYQLSKQSITYSIADSKSLQKIISGTDENTIQRATIGQFECKITDNYDYLSIPFELEENGTKVEDITEVWVYYNDTLKTGRLKYDSDGKQYIYVFMPKQAIMTEMKIIAKSENHMPFSTTFNIGKLNHYKDDEKKEIDYQYVAGPLINGNPNDIIVGEEWHTNDIRNILQRQGIYFRNIFKNDDPQSSTTIILYNIKLEVHYSPKNSQFSLDTHINVRDAVKPNVGIYECTIKNTGTKPLKTSIDIITPPNIRLEKNYIDVDLAINAGMSEKINIIPEYPLVDGFYDILTFCGDIVKKNSISVFSEGLIPTTVTMEPHSGQYNENITLTADIKSSDGSKIHGAIHKVQFYINGYSVDAPVEVYNNKAIKTITPGNYNFTDTGTLRLEARYLGTTKYNSSRGNTTIFIGKNNTKIEIIGADKAVYKNSYEAKAIVKYFDGEQYKPVDDGYVTFYVDKEILSANAASNYTNGTFIASIDSLENPPGDYVLMARYEGSNTFASAQTKKNFEIIGGDVSVLVFDKIARPQENIHLTAKVLDKNNKPVPGGYLDFYNEELNINFKNIEVIDGLGSTPDFPVNINLNNDDANKIYNIKVSYHGAINSEGYNDGEGIGYLTIKKSEVIIEHLPLYQVSQYEPLGIFLQIKDAETNEYISTGDVSVILPGQNGLELQGSVDSDGGVRIVHNLINFTAKEWFELNKWSFEINSPDPDTQDLYKIYDGDYTDLTFIDFSLENGNLFFEDKNRDEEDDFNQNKEYIFIGDDGALYARTDIDELRNYVTGLQDIRIIYHSNAGYKAQTINIENGLNIQSQNVDLDIHSYDLTYTDSDVITCYITKYDEDEVNIPVTDGKVQFIFDNRTLDTVNVVGGKAFLKNELLTSISSGKHLFEVDYIKNDNKTTRSYSLFNLRQAIPSTPIIETDRIVRNKNTLITVKISAEQSLNVPLNGIVSLYLNDEKIGEQYLYGNEILPGIVDDSTITSDMMTNTYYVSFNYIMPEDIDIPNKYTLKAIYEGNEFFTPSAIGELPIQEHPSDVTIDSEDVDISQVIDVAVDEECDIDFIINSVDDIIDEGQLFLIAGQNEIISSAHVSNNKATLKWTPTQIKNYSFLLKYTDAIHYNNKEITINFNATEALDTIVLPNNNYKTIKQALMCLRSNGVIYLNNDIELKKSLNINKDCNIIGVNDVKMINVADIKIDINNNAYTHFNNIHFVSDNNLMQIINKKSLFIYRSILDKNIQLHNSNYLMAQRNFIYGTCTGESSDLNNNWWGSNTPRYDVDTHIIIEVEPLNSPAVISEEIDIIGKMIGSNGREYALPEANFTFGADTGYFSIDSGQTVNHQIQTTYIDAEKEGNIYFTVDNETVKCPVYDYERKTEVIIDDLTEIPINYQIPIKARVQSCADIFYEFDNNNIASQTKLINEGYISFYINDKQVGYVPVKNGEAETNVFFTNKYYNNEIYTLKAIYQPANYYFASENSITFSVTDESNTCFVSSISGNDDNDGTYGTPFKTIKRAINANTSIIYLLNDEYNETEINISHNVIIKSFKNAVLFNELSGNYLFNIQSGTLLECQNIDFTNNSFTNLFNNYGVLKLNKCIISNNEKVFNNHNGEIDVKYSAIVNNNRIANNIDASWFRYCWFGENNPNINNVDYHVQMNIESSKDILYIGTLAHISGLLDTYKHGRFYYKLEEPLPLRIAKFATTYGSMKPLKDYTYNNKSTSLLNTQEDNNTTQYIIDILENTNYIEYPVTLKCKIHDVYDNNATGTVNMYVSGENTSIKRVVTLNNGIAQTIINRLSAGQYTLTCSYINTDDNNNIQTYTSERKFVVKKPDIIVKDFNILDGDNLYYTQLHVELEDNFGNKINNQNINIKIDDNYITTYYVHDGQIITKINYDKIISGQHTLSIDNYNTDSSYDNFIAYKAMNTNMKHINKDFMFKYDSFETNVYNVINVAVKDDEGNSVNGGYITLMLDNEIIASDIEVVDGNAQINNFIIRDIGQHSITIYYSGLENYYYDALFVNNYISAGIFNVIFGIDASQYLLADIGKPFTLTTTVLDVSNQPINQGYVNFYIDDILVNEEPIYVNNGQITIQHDLPNNIISGTHSARLEYIDSTNTYLDTFLSTYVIVGKIPTKINMDTIYGAPGQNTTLDYQISTAYGNVNTGTLIAKYNNNIIGESTVSDNLINQITIKVPFEPDTNDYIINFFYSDETTYADSYLDNKLIIKKNQVNIEPSHTWYYPDQIFHFVGTITDKDGNRINTGKAALYIDNVKETESQDVLNGQIRTSLSFNKAREYPMAIIYEENDYYEETVFKFIFKIDNVDINGLYLREGEIILDGDDITQKDEDIIITAKAVDINQKPLTNATVKFYIDDNPDMSYKPYYIENDILYSLPNQFIETELVFKTLDNYNVKDGIIDIIIDNTTVESYHIAESNKFIEFNIGNLQKGTHTLLLKYHDSALFNNYEKSMTLVIMSKQLQLVINNNEAIIPDNHASDINIHTIIYSDNVPTQITGMIRYYIGLPIYKADEIGNTVISDYDYKFIGIKELDNSSEDIYSYKLPTDLLEYSIDKYETHYKIKAEFIGNDEYDETSNSVDLKIQKQECNITLNNNDEFIEANYRDSITVDFDIDANGSPLVDFYFNNELIGSVIAENNHGSFTYKLNQKYTVKEGSEYYNLRAQFSGSAIDMSTESTIKVHVHPLMPNMDNSHKTATYGGTLLLNDILTDTDNTIINEGTLTYTLGDNAKTIDLGVTNNNQTIDIPDTQNNSLTLHIAYNTNNPNYMIFEKDIVVDLEPNTIILDITKPDKLYRGKNYILNLQASAPTTRLPINITINDHEMTNGVLDLPINLPINQSSNQASNYSINFAGNQFFKPITKEIELNVENVDIVTIDKNADEVTIIDGEQVISNIKTIERALDLVKEYGTIQIIDAPDNQTFIIDKSISIEGESEVNNWAITNESNEVLIKGLTFKNSNGKCIVNNKELMISECTFENGQDSAIYSNGAITVDNCIFKGNQAQDGAGIYISNKNYRTIISSCTFTQNNASGNGSCIYSNKGNDVEISYNEFINNNGTQGVTSSICINGNSYISDNIFYDNNYECEIYLLSGVLEIDNNIFDGLIQSVKGYNGQIDADFNYWGYNDIDIIEEKNSQLITYNNWLISSRKDYEKEIDGQSYHIVVGVIDKYMNRLEKEITSINQVNKDFPVNIVGGSRFKLNQEIKANESVSIKIGQEQISKVSE